MHNMGCSDADWAYFILLHFTLFYLIIPYCTSFYLILLRFSSFYFILLHHTPSTLYIWTYLPVLAPCTPCRSLLYSAAITCECTSPPNTSGGWQQHETVQGREGKGQGRGQWAYKVHCFFLFYLIPAAAGYTAPPFSPSWPHQPNKNDKCKFFPSLSCFLLFERDEKGETPPHHVSFRFDHNRGKPPPCCSCFGHKEEGEAPSHCVSFCFECDKEGGTSSRHVSFHFDCNGTAMVGYLWHHH